MTTLGELVVDAQPGFACGREDADGIFQFRMNNVTNGSALDLSKRRRVPLDAHKKIANFLVAQDDVLFNATNSPDNVGKSVLVPVLEEKAVFSNHFIRLRTDHRRLFPAYLWRWLQWNFQRGLFGSMCRQWVNQATVSRESLLELEVPLPPLDEQRRIAAILDQADELVTARNMTIGLIGNLRQSIFIDMFGAPDRLSKNWVCAPLSDLAHTCSGGTPSRADNSYYGGDIPWVKSGEVVQGLVVSTEEAITEAAVANSSARVMPPGTVLVAMYGATAGKVGILGISAATNQAVCSITPGDRLEVGYLVEVLRSMNDHLLAQRSGGAQPNLSQGVLRGLQIPVPPIEIQEQFCRRLAEVDALDSHVVAALASHSVLFQSLQARAFAGQL